MSLFKRRKRARIVPVKTGKALTSRDILVRLRECWGILNPRRPRPLTSDDVEIIGYNFQLAALYNEVRALEKDGCGKIGFGGESDGDDQSEDDDESEGGDQSEDDDEERWYYAEVYCDEERSGDKPR